jgi:hypothetical protein
MLLSEDTPGELQGLSRERFGLLGEAVPDIRPGQVIPCLERPEVLLPEPLAPDLHRCPQVLHRSAVFPERAVRLPHSQAETGLDQRLVPELLSQRPCRLVEHLPHRDVPPKPGRIHRGQHLLHRRQHEHGLVPSGLDLRFLNRDHDEPHPNGEKAHRRETDSDPVPLHELPASIGRARRPGQDGLVAQVTPDVLRQLER